MCGTEYAGQTCGRVQGCKWVQLEKAPVRAVNKSAKECGTRLGEGERQRERDEWGGVSVVVGV